MIGDLLFHGDPATEKKTGGDAVQDRHGLRHVPPVRLRHASRTSFPKYQEQMSEFATLRDMINWCIEKPNEGEKIDPNGAAMKALEAYIYWSNRNSKLDPGRY